MVSNSLGRRVHLLLLAAGVVVLAVWENPASAQVPATQPNGKRPGGSLIWAVAGRQEAGKPVGFVMYKLAVDANGLYAVGDRQNKGGGFIEKLSPADGSLMWKNYQPMAGANEGMHIAIDKKFMYAAGEPWMLEKRNLSDGELIWQVKGEKGKPYTVVIDSAGAYMGGHGSHVEKRSLQDGSVLWKKAGPASGVILAAAVDSTGVYFGGYERIGRDQHWRVEKRDLKDGSLIWEQKENPSDGADVVYGMAVDATGVYASGFDCAHNSGGEWRIEKRNLSDGKVIWQQVHDLSPRTDKAHGLAIDSTGLYIPGYQDEGQWRIEKRSLTDGSLIWEALSEKNGRLWYAVTVADDAVYVGGHVNREWRIEKRAK